MATGPFPVCAGAPPALVEGLPVEAWFSRLKDRHERNNIEEWGEPCKGAVPCKMTARNQAPRWWFELEIFSSQWRHILCHQVFQEKCTWYGGRGCFLRVVHVKNEGSTVTATPSTTPASASASRAVCFVYKLATREGLYTLLTSSPMTEEPVITPPPTPPPCECLAAAHGDVEVRIDRDGNPHTEACFCSYYGAEGEQRWASASPAAPLNHGGA